MLDVISSCFAPLISSTLLSFGGSFYTPGCFAIQDRALLRRRHSLAVGSASTTANSYDAAAPPVCGLAGASCHAVVTSSSLTILTGLNEASMSYAKLTSGIQRAKRDGRFSKANVSSKGSPLAQAHDRRMSGVFCGQNRTSHVTMSMSFRLTSSMQRPSSQAYEVF
ncbi:hypothetical protein MY4038_007739 [Beauveria bassiana]